MNGSPRAALSIRPAVPADAGRVAEIFNQGVQDRVATFETREADAGKATGWIENDLILVAERDGALVGWAKASPYADRHDYYDGVREATLYVEREARRTGVGRELLDALAGAAGEAGAHKLVGKISPRTRPASPWSADSAGGRSACTSATARWTASGRTCWSSKGFCSPRTYRLLDVFLR